MGDRGPKRSSNCSSGIDMNPLVVAGGFCKKVDAGLINSHPRAVPKVFSYGVYEGIRIGEDGSHGRRYYAQAS